MPKCRIVFAAILILETDTEDGNNLIIPETQKEWHSQVLGNVQTVQLFVKLQPILYGVWMDFLFYMEFTVYCWARQDKMWKSKIIFHFISDSEQLPITWVSSTPLESLQKLASAATSSAWLGQVARVMEHVTRDFTRDVTRDTCSPWWWQSDEMLVSSDSNPFFLGLCPLSQKRT